MATQLAPAAAVSAYLRDFSDSIATLPGARGIDLGHVRGVLSGRAMFSRFYDAVFPSLVTPEDVAAVHEIGLQQEVAPVWLLDEDRVERVLAGALEACGFDRKASWTGMWRGAEPLPEADAPPDIAVTRVEDESTLRRWGRICSEVDQFSAAQKETFTELFLALQHRRAGWTHLVARSEERDVATASLFVMGRIAAVDWVSTVADARRRGVASYLVSRLLAEARGTYDIAVLTSTEAGRPLYERLGFRECSRILAYRLRKDRGSSAGAPSAS